MKNRKRTKPRLTTDIPNEALTTVEILEASSLGLFDENSENVGVAMMRNDPLSGIAHGLAHQLAQNLCSDVDPGDFDGSVIVGLKAINLMRILWHDTSAVLSGYSVNDISDLFGVLAPITNDDDWKELKDDFQASFSARMRNISFSRYENFLMANKELCVTNVLTMMDTAYQFATDFTHPFTISTWGDTEQFKPVDAFNPVAVWFTSGMPHFSWGVDGQV